MKYFKISCLIIIIFLSISLTSDKRTRNVAENKFVLVIHGGAGFIYEGRFEKEEENAYIAKINEALNLGKNILENGGSALDAVEMSIMVLENSPLFNAGKGSVLNEHGMNEMDASIMDGKFLNAGAVAGVHRIKNPIKAARLVMDNSKHVLLFGKGAEIFSEKEGLELVDPAYFIMPEKLQELQNAKDKGSGKVSSPDFKFGTVGAVALDQKGNLAAGTSTGGMTNKMQGRIGDSPIIGAGTYADNNSCAVSATGHGEYFIRNAIAFQMTALMKYKQMTVADAGDYLINDVLRKLEANGGLIALDCEGNFTMPFNTPGMFRGFAREDGATEVLLYK